MGLKVLLTLGRGWTLRGSEDLSVRPHRLHGDAIGHMNHSRNKARHVEVSQSEEV